MTTPEPPSTPRRGPAALMAALFALLAVSAATGAPGAFVDPPLPRGLRTLDAIIRPAVGLLGHAGAAAGFTLLGVLSVAGSLRPASGRPALRGAGAAVGIPPEPPADAVRAAWDILLQPREPGPVPAWALRLRSPFAPSRGATSWLGGLPTAPPGFDWPRDPDGTPQTFLAQIDLGALAPDPRDDGRRAALPDRGALLVFFGEACTVRVLSEAEVARSAPVPPPPGLPPASARGYWIDSVTLGAWAVDPVPFHSVDADTADLGCPVGCRSWGDAPPLRASGTEAARAWAELTSTGFGAPLAQAAREAPSALHPAIEAELRRWRGHRLFGIEPDFSNNGEDLRGWSCLISVAADPVLGTEMDHSSGVSVWFRTEDLVAGRLDRGQVVWRCSV